ncbi:MAG: inner-membrane translocator [Oscillospiraceae bacterium]|nr:inner-membrane translocator [Oscillospiraceae bacterium]
MEEKKKRQSGLSGKLLNFAPVIGLAVMAAVFLAIASAKDVNLSYSFKNILNQSIITMVVATGAIYIYTLGSFDISLGASMCVSALIGAMAYNRTESLAVMLLACVGCAIGISLVSSVLASVFNLPVFVTTIAMLSLLNALALVLIKANGTGDVVQVPAPAVKGINTVWFKLLVLLLYIAVCVISFNFMKLGRQEKFMGGNPECAKLTGLSSKKLSILGFVMAGIGIGLGAFLTITYAPTLSRNTGGSVGMDVIISIVFGGMPVSGGARSKIYSAVVGSLSMTLLSQIMLMLNLNSGIGQMVKATIFILVVYVSMLNSRKSILPR